MSSTRPPERRGRDLDDRIEIAEFVTRFYRDIAQDESFHRYFDAGWHGPMADAARRRGHGLAWAMAKRLTGEATRQFT